MISNPGGPGVRCVAADTNVLLSAITGKAALRVFTQSAVEVVTTVSIFGEIREYLPFMAKTYGLAEEILEAQLRLLGVAVHPPESYRRHLAAAVKRIGKRDPDDVDLLALALALEIPIWSNDSDFASAGVEWYTTARLLKTFEVGS